jgi:hypothetical protein
LLFAAAYCSFNKRGNWRGAPPQPFFASTLQP